jgi:hemoglobin
MPLANLPLSTPGDSEAVLEREQEISLLITRFYEAARNDAVLGPVFEAHVADWDKHLRAMNDFWSAAIYHTGRYSGRPLEAHRLIPDIRAEHFPGGCGSGSNR